MDWNSKPIEEISKSSQAYLMPPNVTADIGFFKSLSLAKSGIDIKKNPDTHELKGVVPEYLKARWLVLKKQYS